MTKEVTNLYLVEDGIDYSKPDADRTFYLDIDGQRIWVTKEQYDSFKRPLWNEKKERELQGKCLIEAERGGVKRCRKPSSACAECPYYQNNHTNGHIVSLDRLYDAYEYEIADDSESIVDRLIEEEKERAVHKAVSEIQDPTDRKIIELFMEGLNDILIAKSLGFSRKTVNKRRLRTFTELAEKLKNYK